MCFSLLMVSYKADKDRATIKCTDEADERGKIAETMAKDQVLKVEVFRAQRIVNKREVLEEIPYKAPAVEVAA